MLDGARDGAQDGRDVDETLGALEGEGAQIAVRRAGEAYPVHLDPDAGRAVLRAPSATPEDDTPTYYGLPTLKEPVWTASIPLYFYTGGLAGASLALGAAAQLAGDRTLHGLSIRCRRIGFGAIVVSAGLLVEDLGRRGRFLNMLRVFRPTSPMSVGSWILALCGAATTGAQLPGALGDACGLAAGALGVPLAGYTAVLLAGTAVPLWQSSRRTLPFLFVSGAIGSASSALDLLDLEPREAIAVHRFGLAGKLAELLATFAVEHEAAADAERVARPLHTGASGALWTAAKVLTAASLAVSLLPGRGRGKRVVGALLGTLGSVAMRFAVFHAGKRSTRDPRAAFAMQRTSR